MIKKIFSYAIFSFLVSGIGFITSIYLTKMLKPEEFGMIGIFQSLTFIAIPMIAFSSLGLVSVNKVLLCRKEYREYTNSYFTLGFLLSFVLLLILLFTSIFYQTYFLMLIAIPFIAFLKLLNDTHSLELVQTQKSNEYGLSNIVEVSVGLLFSIIFISYFNLSWEGRIIAVVTSLLISFLFRYYIGFVSIKFFKININKAEFKKIIIFGWPLMIAIGAGWLHHNSGKFILLNYYSLHEVGLFSFALTIGMIVNIINTSVVNAITPAIYKAIKNKNVKSLLIKYIKYYVLLIFPLLIFIGYLSEWYIPLFFSVDYNESSKIILWIFIANGIGALYNIVGLVLNFFKKTKLQTIIYYFGTIIGVVVSVLLIPTLGLIAPAIGLIVIYFIIFILTAYYGWKILNEKGIK